MDGDDRESHECAALASEPATAHPNESTRAADHRRLPHRAQGLERTAGPCAKAGLGRGQLFPAGPGVTRRAFVGTGFGLTDDLAEGAAPVNASAGPPVAPGPSHGR